MKRRPLPVVSITEVWEAYGGGVLGVDRGGSQKATCPLHDDGSASASVNEEEGLWNCFTCNVGGDVFSLIMEVKGVGFVPAVEIAEGFTQRSDGPVRAERGSSSLLPGGTGNRRERGSYVPPWRRM